MNEQIFCKCGCGDLIDKFDSRGRERRFKYRHQPKGISPSRKIRDKISKSLMGKPSPNKGKKTGKPAWNSGTQGLCKPNSGSFERGKPQPHGKDHWNWKGGLTTLQDLIRNSSKYLEWRLMIFGRDNYTCRKCDVRGVYFEAHHIKSFSKILRESNIQTLEDALNCKELWNLNNGITYCKDCHKLLKQKSGKL